MIFEPIDPVPHWYTDPEAEIPPEAVSVLLIPGQLVPAPEMVVGAVERLFTVTVTFGPYVGAVVQGEPSILLTQYVVVADGLTIIDAPVCPVIILFPMVPVPHW